MRRLLTVALMALFAAAGCQSNQAMKDGTMTSAKLCSDPKAQAEGSVEP